MPLMGNRAGSARFIRPIKNRMPMYNAAMGFPLSAFWDPETVWVLIPITALLIPIVSMLVKHQQRMAEIVHRNVDVQASGQIEALRGEIAQLKQLVHQQAIQMDNLLSASRQSSSPPISNRIET